MSQFAIARRTMLDNQIRTADVTDGPVLAAFGSVPRELFVPDASQALAYTDIAHRLTPGTPGRWLMAPSPLAKLIQLGNIMPTDKVLIVGSGSGYSVAIVADMAAAVTGLEEDDGLVSASTAKLTSLGLVNATIVKGTLTEGCAAAAPFNVIFIEGSVDLLPDALKGQLAEGGRLVVVEGHGAAGCARVYVNTSGLVTGRNVFNCSAKPLPGFQRNPEFTF